MDQLPAELWIYICSLACTDGGHTGRSLSLVSRRFSELSKPYTLQCLALTTPRQVRLLGDILERPGFQGGVKSLFISCPDLSQDGDDDDSDYVDVGSDGKTESTSSSNSEEKSLEGEGMDVGGDTDDGEGGDYLPLYLEERAKIAQEPAETAAHGSEGSSPMSTDEPHLAQLSQLDEVIRKKDENAVDNLLRLLKLVSDTLLILSVHWTSMETYLIEEMIPSLPNLQELCIYRAFTGEDEVEPQTEEPTPLLFPSLKRLHFGGYADERPGSFSQYLSGLAPSLTELRCSIFDLPELENGAENRLPPTVTRIIFEMSTLSQENAEIMPSEEVMASLVSGGDGTASPIKLEFPGLERPYGMGEWERQWLSRADGGCGCW